MANLTEKQQRLLDAVRETYEQVAPALARLEEDYIHAEYRAKAPVRDAIQAAEEAGVPFKRITHEAIGFSYPGKLRDWIRTPEAVIQKIMAGEAPLPKSTEFEDAVESVKSVVRNPSTGEFTVSYLGNSYTVLSYGTAQECWSSPEAGVPQGVYEMIQEEFPTWILLEDEED